MEIYLYVSNAYPSNSNRLNKISLDRDAVNFRQDSALKITLQNTDNT